MPSAVISMKASKRTAPCAVASALAKRARLERAAARATDAIELTSLLLSRSGHAPGHEDPDAVIAALEREYSPRVAQLLYRIASSLDVGDHAAIQPFDAAAASDDSASAKDSSVTSLSESDDSETDDAPADDPDRRKPGKAYKQETEIALSRIFELGKVASVEDPSVAPFDPYHGPSVVCMSGFGELGRFGNQVLQYAFLRVYARRHGVSEVQVPAWVGAGLFGLNDRPVQRAFPAVTETADAKANSTFTYEFMDYIQASNAGRPVPRVDAAQLAAPAGAHDALPAAGVNVDFWGWFQWHTSCYAPYKALIQDVFAPVPALQEPMTAVFDRELRFRGGIKRTVVGLHLRLGDYQNISASSFGYCAPTAWYLELLDKIWHTLDNPILFVASDDIDAVLRDFARFNPMTADMIGLQVPQEMKHLKAGFFPDWWGLTQCDVLAISNSTFSFTASMVNTRPGARFYRAHYADRMVEIDPWSADPIVHRDMTRGSVGNAVETLQVLYNTQGTKGVMRNLLYELPYQGLRMAIMKAVLWKNARTNQKDLAEKEAAGAKDASATTAPSDTTVA